MRKGARAEARILAHSPPSACNPPGHALPSRAGLRQQLHSALAALQEDDYWAKHDNPKGKKDAKREEQVGAPLCPRGRLARRRAGCCTAVGNQHSTQHARLVGSLAGRLEGQHLPTSSGLE